MHVLVLFIPSCSNSSSRTWSQGGDSGLLVLFLCYVVCVETVSQIKSDWLIKRLNSVLPSNWGLLTVFYSCFDRDDSSSHHLYSTTSPDAAPQELRATSFNYSLRLFPPCTAAASLPPPARLQGRLTETAQWHTTWRPGWHAGLEEGAHTDTKKQQHTFCPFCSCVDTSEKVRPVHTHKCQHGPTNLLQLDFIQWR